MDGYVALHRKLLTSSIFQNEKLLKVFVYCLLKASHSERDQKVGRQTVHLLPGQFVFGRKKAALELEMKESTVRDYINLLKEDGTIDIKSTNKYSVITVVNWELYQTNNKNSDSKNASISDSKKTTEGQQINTNNNVKNVKNENKTSNSNTEELSSGPENPFNAYYLAYGQANTFVIDDINFYLDSGIEEKAISYAIEKAAKNGSKFQYARGILDNWLKKELFTFDAVVAAEEEFNKRKVERIHAGQRPKTNKPSPNIKGTDPSRLDFSARRNSL